MKPNLFSHLSIALFLGLAAQGGSAQVISNSSSGGAVSALPRCGGVIIIPIEGSPVTSPRSATASSAAFHFSVTYDSNVTSAQRTVIEQALSEWEAIILSPGVTPSSYSISFKN